MSKAEGIIAIGFMARGIISVGVLSMGIASAGLLSLGVLTAGAVSVGIFALMLIGFSFINGFMPWIETAWGFLSLLWEQR